MRYYKAPENCGGCSVGGAQFTVENGMIAVPDEGDYDNLLAPHGFVPCPAPVKAVNKEAKKAVKKAAVQAAATANTDGGDGEPGADKNGTEGSVGGSNEPVAGLNADEVFSDFDTE